MSVLRGAVGFLTRLPVGADGDDWDDFRHALWAFPTVGYLVGGLLALALLVPTPSAVAVAFPAWLLLLTGINHLDGVADLGDAAVVHGDAADRATVLKDTTVGVGATATVGLVLAAMVFAAFGLTGLPLPAAVVAVVAAEVGAKLTMAGVACLGSARHEGLGSALTSVSGRTDLLPALVVALPVVVVPVVVAPTTAPVATAAALGAVAGGGLVAWWANRLLAGVNGDVFGAAGEVGRLVGLHAGVIAWTLS